MRWLYRTTNIAVKIKRAKQLIYRVKRIRSKMKAFITVKARKKSKRSKL
jgi:hypothetical protein